VLREDLLEMLALNVRHPRDFRGDLAAQIGAARLGHQRLTSVIAEFGASVLEEAVEAMLDAAERHARSIVSSWKDGVYDGEAVLDDDGFGKTNIVIRAHVTKQGSDVTIDLTGSDPQVTGFINSSHANRRWCTRAPRVGRMPFTSLVPAPRCRTNTTTIAVTTSRKWCSRFRTGRNTRRGCVGAAA
jgi:N-methylhydantoinase B/oxoprolinase/acetone carboxylase alpha subunit